MFCNCSKKIQVDDDDGVWSNGYEEAVLYAWNPSSQKVDDEPKELDWMEWVSEYGSHVIITATSTTSQSDKSQILQHWIFHETDKDEEGNSTAMNP